MNKVLLAVGILSASVAVGQTTRTTKSSSTSTSTSNYNNSNTNNYNSSNATSSGSSYSGTSGSMSTGTTGAGATGTTGTYNSNGTYNNSTAVTPSGSNNYNTMGTSGATTTDTYSTSSPSGSMSTGATGTTGTYNSNGTYNNSTTVTPSGSGNYNTMGTSGATTTPSTSYDNNSMNSGTSTTTTNTYSTTSRTAPDPAGRNGYNNFVFGIYAGLNATSFKGESIDAENPSARLGYQAGFFVRGGGRLFGQIGAEYFASSSNYFRAGNGSSTQAIRDYINIQYIQVPVYIGYKLTDSERGNSAIRVQVGAEYANRISSNSNSFNLSKDEIKSGSFNALGQLGFDFGPFLIDLTYHYGLGDAVQINTFQGSSRRILSASVGFKF